MPTALSAPAARTQQHADLDLLQGAWKTIAGRREARLLIVGSRFAFEYCDGDGHIYMGSLTIDAHAVPKRMDLLIEEGLDHHKGQLALCIYQLESDIMRWCPSKPGSMVRLTGFPSVDDDKYLSLVFKHARPSRGHS